MTGIADIPAGIPASGAETKPLRMRDLTKEAGLSRQAIHFYIDEGLLPPPTKKGRNSALYSPEHLERLRWIQRLQREHFLSLNAIKSVLSGEGIEEFTPQQKVLLRRVREQLPGPARKGSAGGVPLSDFVPARVSEDDIAGLERAGLIELQGGGDGRTMSQIDADIVECFVRYQEVGATRERGYGPEVLAIVDRAIDRMVDELSHLYARNWINASLSEAVAFAEAVAPIDERLMATLLRKKMRSVSALGDDEGSSSGGKPGKRPQKRKVS